MLFEHVEEIKAISLLLSRDQEATFSNGGDQAPVIVNRPSGVEVGKRGSSRRYGETEGSYLENVNRRCWSQV